MPVDKLVIYAEDYVRLCAYMRRELNKKGVNFTEHISTSLQSYYGFYPIRPGWVYTFDVLGTDVFIEINIIDNKKFILCVLKHNIRVKNITDEYEQ